MPNNGSAPALQSADQEHLDRLIVDNHEEEEEQVVGVLDETDLAPGSNTEGSDSPSSNPTEETHYVLLDELEPPLLLDRRTPGVLASIPLDLRAPLRDSSIP
jgi:hypothetical protein